MKFYEKGKSGETFHIEEFKEDACREHYDYLMTIPVAGDALKDLVKSGVSLPIYQIDHVAFFSHGYILFITYEPIPEGHSIFIRFAKVFEQTYTRFLDLQKAEKQAREAQIEVAIERVRAQSMAMQHPDDLNKVNKEILSQLSWLQIPGLTGVTFYLIDEKGWVKAWDFSSPGNIGDQKSYTLQFDSNRHEMLGFPFKMLIQTDLNYFVVDYPLEKLEKAVYEFEEIDPAMAKIVKEALSSGLLTHQWGACCRISNGLLGIDLVNPPKGDTEAIVLKMAGAFNQAYTRFLDLQKAEAQAREAQIEAALERVRSKTMAMHTTSELQGVIHTVHRELLNLELNIAGGSFIVINAEIDQEIICWGSGGTTNTSDRVYIPHFNKPFYTHLVEKIKSGPCFFTEDYTEDEKKEFFAFLFAQEPWSKLSVEEQKAVLASPGGYTRSCCVSQHTTTFIINDLGEKFSEEENDVLKRFAKVFEQTYTRFLDLQKAEAHALRAEQDLIAIKEARKKAEDALAELQQAQKQLIQSEKMASLGELTAGIAHEIQNPLNFVNNYSEVNVELIEELRDEVGKVEGRRDKALEKELWESLVDNEAKIHHHGKRADAIVRGMLQHSRASSGTKEPTNLNALADEYMRLAYQSFLAKEPGLEIELSTDYEKNLPLIEVVPQDIGRVLLNILNNAFQACAEKSRMQLDGYWPTVSVVTQKSPDSIEINITDNGPGIPDAIKDKIFQPFFTTKPTGQGTGLGLSLSYDIVKVHRGSLEVVSKENEGTEFTIQLPFKAS